MSSLGPYSFTKLSACGNSGILFSCVTPNAFNLPALTKGPTCCGVPNERSTWSPMTSVSMGAPPRYGMRSIGTLASWDNSAVSYTHLRAHETRHDLVCRLLL